MEDKTQHKKHHILYALLLMVGTFGILGLAFGAQPNFVNGSQIIEIPNQTQPQSLFNNLFVLKQEEEVEARYVLQELKRLGDINAQSFVVGDLDTGEIIFERKPHTQYPIASITKYMTAFTAAEKLNPYELATVTAEKLKVQGNRGRFKVGETLSIRDLIYPLLLVSSNDAGEIIAEQRNRDAFIQAMNELSQEHGLYNTNFEDPTGLSRNNISTGRDLFRMMRLVRNTHPEIVDISRLKSKSDENRTWYNINKAASYSEFQGGKTGYTNAAQQTSIGYFQIKLANDQVKNLGIVILRSPTRQQDTRNILEYIKRYVAYL
jgi:D-alanyl-D-alanine carboxypeptidase